MILHCVILYYRRAARPRDRSGCAERALPGVPPEALGGAGAEEHRVYYDTI